MLVLGRKPGERILIGEDIVVTVVRFNGGSVRLGIEAPRDFPVIREELKQPDIVSFSEAVGRMEQGVDQVPPSSPDPTV